MFSRCIGLGFGSELKGSADANSKQKPKENLGFLDVLGSGLAQNWKVRKFAKNVYVFSKKLDFCKKTHTFL